MKKYIGLLAFAVLLAAKSPANAAPPNSKIEILEHKVSLMGEIIGVHEGLIKWNLDLFCGTLYIDFNYYQNGNWIDKFTVIKSSISSGEKFNFLTYIEGYNPNKELNFEVQSDCNKF